MSIKSMVECMDGWMDACRAPIGLPWPSRPKLGQKKGFLRHLCVCAGTAVNQSINVCRTVEKYSVRCVKN
jgi:hypothetical protein